MCVSICVKSPWSHQSQTTVYPIPSHSHPIPPTTVQQQQRLRILGAECALDGVKLRNTLLELTQRFPHNDALRQYAPPLMDALLHTLRFDMEENGLVALKVILTDYRGFLQELQGFAGRSCAAVS